MRSLVVDGNFTADHIRQKRAADDVWLTNGEGMMTAQGPYHAHLAIAIETKDVSESMIFMSLKVESCSGRSGGEPFPGNRGSKFKNKA
jgi:hypothetical protein